MSSNVHAPAIQRLFGCLTVTVGILACCDNALAQKTLTWEDAKRRLQSANPTLQAARIGVEEARASEITAFLRPNPDLSVSFDQLTPFTGNPYRPFTTTLPLVSGSYLLERQQKRQLRLESARKATAIAASELADQERTLLFNLRAAFIQVLQHKAIVAVARESLEFYDRLLAVSRDRFNAGDIAAVDLDRVELQRVQFESDVQTAAVNLRTAKIQLLAILNDNTPVDRLDVDAPFTFTEVLTPLEEFRQYALESRPDLQAALQAVTKARTDARLAVANGSTDPTVGMDFGRDPPIAAFFGVSASIPLRIFDRNQGEKARTQLEIGRSDRLVTATRLQITSDVDSAYASIQSTLTLLRPYKAKYLAQAARVRETISFSYQHGGASLLDFLQAQQEYRGIQLSYLNLIAAYLNSTSQMNFVIGREVLA
jgi:cobalt-zinc-cadmium efflux system outer membrane protein